MVGGKATPSPSHARNALARASQQLDRGNLSAMDYSRIVTRANGVLAECDPLEKGSDVATKKKKRKPMSAAQKKAFAERMKRARKKAAKKRKPAKKRKAVKKKTTKRKTTAKRKAPAKRKTTTKRKATTKRKTTKRKTTRRKAAPVAIEAYLSEAEIRKTCGF